MMNKEMKFQSNSFKDNLDLFEKKVNLIKDNLNKIKNNMKDITGENETWNSKVGVAVHEKYYENEKEFENISKELDNYVIFLKQVLESQTAEEIKQEKSIDEQQNYLDVNE